MVKPNVNLDTTALGLPQGAVKIVVNRTFLQVESERRPMDDFDAHAGIFKRRSYSDSRVFEATEEQDTEMGSTCSLNSFSSEPGILDDDTSASHSKMVSLSANLDITALEPAQGADKLIVSRTFLHLESERTPMDDFDAHAGIFKLRSYSDSCAFKAFEEQEPEVGSPNVSSSEPGITHDGASASPEKPANPIIQDAHQHQQGSSPQEESQTVMSPQYPDPCRCNDSILFSAGHSAPTEEEDLEQLLAKAEFDVAVARAKLAARRASVQKQTSDDSVLSCFTTVLPHDVGAAPPSPSNARTSGILSGCSTGTAVHSTPFSCVPEFLQAPGQASFSHARQSRGTVSSSVRTDETTLTTIMLRNLPNDYSRDMALEFLDSEGFKNRYDFFYLPFDFKRRSGLGYAFVNMVSPEDAQRAKADLPGFRNWIVASSKVLEVQYTSPTQGLTSNIARFRNSPVMHPDVPEHFKPLTFHQGCRLPFPPPTRNIRPPTDSS